MYKKSFSCLAPTANVNVSSLRFGSPLRVESIKEKSGAEVRSHINTTVFNDENIFVVMGTS